MKPENELTLKLEEVLRALKKIDDLASSDEVDPWKTLESIGSITHNAIQHSEISEPHLVVSPLPRLVLPLFEWLKGHVDSRLDGEHGLAAATIMGFERMLAALEAIEEIYIDGDNTYDDWRAMGELARNALHEPNAEAMRGESDARTNQTAYSALPRTSCSASSEDQYECPRCHHPKSITQGHCSHCATIEGAPCPDCGGETFRDEGRVTWCRDCGWNKSPFAFVGSAEGQWTFEKCPKCHARMLKNDAGDRWCSYVNCSYSILPNDHE